MLKVINGAGYGDLSIGKTGSGNSTRTVTGARRRQYRIARPRARPATSRQATHQAKVKPELVARRTLNRSGLGHTKLRGRPRRLVPPVSPMTSTPGTTGAVSPPPRTPCWPRLHDEAITGNGQVRHRARRPGTR